jgi:hypothetical protein
MSPGISVQPDKYVLISFEGCDGGGSSNLGGRALSYEFIGPARYILLDAAFGWTRPAAAAAA